MVLGLYPVLCISLLSGKRAESAAQWLSKGIPIFAVLSDVHIIAWIGPSVRCSNPHATTTSTAWQTLSQEV